MSVISKLVMLGAAGAGGDNGWALEVIPTSPANGASDVKAILEKSNGQFICSGRYAKGSLGLVFNSDGSVSSFHGVTDASGSASAAIYSSTMFEDSGQNVWFGGYWYSSSQVTGEAGWFVKTSDGDPLSSVSGLYNSNSRGDDLSLAGDASDNLYVSFYGYDGLRGTAVVRKYNSALSTQWTKAYAPNQHTLVRYATWDGSALYLGVTTTINESSGGRASDLVSIDTNGNLNAAYRSYSGVTGTTFSEGQSIAFDSSYVYTIGQSNDIDTDGIDCAHIRKINKSTGALVWERGILFKVGATKQYGEGRAIAVGDDGSVYITAEHRGVGKGAIVKYDSAGVIQWAITVGKTTYNSEFYGLTIGSDGFLYAGGFTGSAVDNNILLLKVPLDGLSPGTYGDYTVATPLFTAYNSTFLTFSDVGGSLGAVTLSTPTVSNGDAVITFSDTLTPF